MRRWLKQNKLDRGGGGDQENEHENDNDCEGDCEGYQENGCAEDGGGSRRESSHLSDDNQPRKSTSSFSSFAGNDGRRYSVDSQCSPQEHHQRTQSLESSSGGNSSGSLLPPHLRPPVIDTTRRGAPVARDDTTERLIEMLNLLKSTPSPSFATTPANSELSLNEYSSASENAGAAFSDENLSPVATYPFFPLPNHHTVTSYVPDPERATGGGYAQLGGSSTSEPWRNTYNNSDPGKSDLDQRKLRKITGSYGKLNESIRQDVSVTDQQQASLQVPELHALTEHSRKHPKDRLKELRKLR